MHAEWLRQLLGSAVFVCTTKLKVAPKKFARHLNNPDFKACKCWVARFKLWHELSNKRTHGEALDAASEGVDEFYDKVQCLIDSKGLSLNQVYNCDETGLFYCSLPTNTLADGKEQSVTGHKISKTLVLAMCAANTRSSHRLKPVIICHAKQPWCLWGLMDRFPVIYYPSMKAWFIMSIFGDWFSNLVNTEIVHFQTETLGIPHNLVKALILLDNTPVHPSGHDLVGENGRIRCLFLPSNTTFILQPMDHWIIAATKCLYCQNFLCEVMVVLDEEEAAAEEDTRGGWTLERLKKNALKSVMYNWSSTNLVTNLENGVGEPIVWWRA